MSILKSNNANFKISLQWLLDKGWEVYDFDLAQVPNLLCMSKHILDPDGVHLNVYLSPGEHDSEIEKIVFIKECEYGSIAHKVLDIKDKKMMDYLFL